MVNKSIIFSFDRYGKSGFNSKIFFLCTAGLLYLALVDISYTSRLGNPNLAWYEHYHIYTLYTHLGMCIYGKKYVYVL